MSTLAATEYALDPLSGVRHRNARAARELADWLSWLEVGKKAPRTIANYRRTVEALLEAFPRREFDQFTDGDLLQFLARKPPKSRHIPRSHLSSWFTWGRKTRRLTENPCDLLPQIRYTPQRVYDIFTEAEVLALCGLPSPDGQLMTLLHWTGIRRSEARLMTGKRVDLDSRHIIVIEGAKRDESRVVPMVQRVQTAAAELLTLEGVGPNDFLWYDRPGGTGGQVRRTKAIAQSSFQRWWERCIADAEIRYRKPHMTRHTFATKMREKGMKAEEVQALLGHKSIRTTMDTYVHTSMVAVGERMRELVGDKA